jgi:transcription antitermination factor NusG
VELVKMDLKPEQRVRVIAGPLMDQEGKIIEIKNKVAKVAIDSLGYILVADIDKGKLMSANHTNY